MTLSQFKRHGVDEMARRLESEVISGFGSAEVEIEIFSAGMDLEV
jgi:hypothetical protein